MKIVEKTSNLLVYEQRSWAFGVLFIVGGVVFAVLLANDPEAKAWQAWVAVVAFAVIGLLLIWRTTVVFDRGEQMVHIERRRFGRRRRVSVPFAEVASVRLDLAVDVIETPACWRVLLVRRDGTAVPLDDAYTAPEEQ
ncbi:MAG TPA: hypothetical protein VI382_04875, partial [Candidatus Manganitrophaceae bacterium]|nr:hypothetical protein [Candidatus Manganitrophaceae bacterium]